MKPNKPTYTAYLELPDGPLGEHGLRDHLQDEIAVVEGFLICWPVMVTLHLEKKKQGKVSLET